MHITLLYHISDLSVDDIIWHKLLLINLNLILMWQIKKKEDVIILLLVLWKSDVFDAKITTTLYFLNHKEF